MLIEDQKIVDDHPLVKDTKDGRYDVFLLDAGFRQALAAMRSLGKHGLSIAALATRETLPVPAFSSRWCMQKFVSPASENTPQYLEELRPLLRAISPRVLIPSSDGTIELIRQHRAELEQYTRIALASESALQIAVSKEQTLEIARQLGLAIPKGVSITTVEEVAAVLREVGLPAVIKPSESWDAGQGIRLESHLVTTPEEARYAADLLTRGGGTALFQQYLSGRREAVSFLYAHGQVHARFTQWARRTNPPLGGASVLRQSIATPEDIGQQAERLVREIDLEGYSEVEFRRDGAGRPYLMEINPRLSASVDIAVRSGVDFPYLLYQWANGERIDVVADYQTGLWMRDLGGDISSTVAALLQRGRPGVPAPARALLDFCGSFLRPTLYDYLDPRDLLPMGTAIAGWCKRVPEQIQNSRRRRSAQHNALKHEE